MNESIDGGIWAITPQALRSLPYQFADHIAGAAQKIKIARFDDDPGDDDPACDPEDPSTWMHAVRTPEMCDGGILRLDCSGIIGKRLDSMETFCGGLDVDDLLVGLQRAIAAAGARAVVMDWDSPGGHVTGVAEAAQKIRDLCASSPIPILSFTETQMCSAAYWLGSQADEVVCTPSASLGSIGVYNAVIDESRAWAMAGLKMELFKAGDYKAAGLPGLSLSPASKKQMQARVDRVHQLFAGAVRAARGDIDDGAMQGQIIPGENAVEANLADGIVLHRADFLGRIRSETRRPNNPPKIAPAALAHSPSKNAPKPFAPDQRKANCGLHVLAKLSRPTAH